MWIVERNVFPRAEEDRLITRLNELQIPFDEMSATELRRNLPSVAEDDVLRGSCWLILQYNQSPQWRRDVWGTATDFAYSTYAPRYREVLLNYPYRSMSFHELCWVRDELFAKDPEGVFVRPDDGFKSLEGGLVRPAAFETWMSQIQLLQVRGSTPLIVAPPKQIHAEWRLVIVDKDIVASSQYRPACRSGCPDLIRDFVAWTIQTIEPPCRAFVMDVAGTPVGPMVVEIGCAGCVAFYDANERDIIERLNAL